MKQRFILLFATFLMLGACSVYADTAKDLPSPDNQAADIAWSAEGMPRVTLSWRNPVLTGGLLTHIYRSQERGALGILIAELRSPNSLQSYTDVTVITQQSYYYTIRSADIAGNSSSNTNQVAVSIGDQPGSGTQTLPDLQVLSIVALGNNALELEVANSGRGIVDHPIIVRVSDTTFMREYSQQIFFSSDVPFRPSSLKVRIPNVLLDGGKHVFVARIDPDHTVDESNEDNNSFSQTINLQEVRRPPMPTDIVLTREPYARGTQVRIRWGAMDDTRSQRVRIYRSYVKNQQGVFQAEAPVNDRQWVDEHVEGPNTYYYTFTSIDSNDIESLPTQQYAIDIPRLSVQAGMLPDLQIKSVSIAPNGKDIQVVVANALNGVTPFFTVSVKTDNGMTASARMQVLSGIGSATVSIPTALGAGKHDIHVQIDTDNEVEEFNEENNAGDFTVTIPGAPTVPTSPNGLVAPQPPKTTAPASLNVKSKSSSTTKKPVVIRKKVLRKRHARKTLKLPTPHK